jgi:putative membrane protein
MNDSENLNQNKRDDLPRWIKSHLGPEDLQAIEAKITDMERMTAGEIVLLITRRSFDWKSHHQIVTLLVLLLFMIFFEDVLVNWINSQFFINTAAGELGLKVAIVGMVFLFSYLISQIGLIYRLALPNHVRRKMAETRAELEFFRSDIKNTKAATGILLFLAIDDRQAVVLADKSIADKLPAHTWDDILMKMLAGIKSRQSRTGILTAVEMSGAILKEHFPIQPGDTNELKNHVIIKN